MDDPFKIPPVDQENILINHVIAKQTRNLLKRHKSEETQINILAKALCKDNGEAKDHFYGWGVFSAYDIYRLSRFFECHEEYFFDGVDDARISQTRFKEALLKHGIRL